MIGVLGGLRILHATDDPADPGSGVPLTLERKARELLTLVALHAPAALTVDELSRVLWDDPPDSAGKTVRSHVSRIRTALREAGEPDAVVTVGAIAYRLVADTDVLEVTRLRAQARGLGTGDPLAAEVLHRARRTWSGAPQLPGTVAGEALLVGWEREHQQLVGEHLDALVRGDHPEAALGELARLTAADPLDEPGWVAYVSALHRSSRQAEALDAAASARRALAEVGLDPGPALVAAQAAVLAGEPRPPVGTDVSAATSHQGPPAGWSTPRYAREGTTAYVVLSEGSPDLVLLNPAMVTVDGLLDEPHVRQAHEQVAALGRLVCLDRRGVGLSAPLDHGEPPLDQWVADVEGVIAHAGLSRPFLIANFDTGLVGIEYAARHSDELAGLVLVNCFASYVRRPGYPYGLDEATTRDLIESTVDPARDRPVDTAGLVAPSLAGDDGFREWWARIGRRGAGPGTARTIREAGTGLDLRGRLAEVRIPVLLVHQRQCTNVDPGHTRYLADALPDARLRMVNGVDGVWFGQPEDTVAEIASFVRGGVR